MGLTLMAPPTEEPLMLTEAKAHLRVDLDWHDEDDYITDLIKEAREYAENQQGRSYMAQTWNLTLDDWPDGDTITLPRPPLVSIESIQYRDTEGQWHTMDHKTYVVDTDAFKGRVRLAYGCTWPIQTLDTVAAIAIAFKAGYASAALVPSPVKRAMKLLIGDGYLNRESGYSKETLFAVDNLLGQEEARW